MRTISTAPFGRTGHESSRVIFGAVALSGASERESAELLDLLLVHGINHIDTAASYGDSEDQLRPWMREHRDHFFLATKTGERTAAAARESLLRSLDRMRVDQIDHVQLHNLVHPGEWDTALGPEGALEALIEARDEGLTRFIGVTGHGLTAPWMHSRALERFPFDSVLAPYNAVAMRDTQYAADFEELAAACLERGVALQTIKAITAGPWGARPHTAVTWYEPLSEQQDIDTRRRRCCAWRQRTGTPLHTSHLATSSLIKVVLTRLRTSLGAPLNSGTSKPSTILHCSC